MTAPVESAKRRHLHWLEPALRLLLLLVFLGGCAYVVVQLLSLRAQLDAEQAATAKLGTALNQSRTQLTDNGITPKAPPATTIVQGIPGATGQSIVGPQGPAGAAGVSPDPAAIAQLVLSMVHPSPGPKGDPGVPGVPGKDSTVAGPPGVNGQNGSNGKDSNVPGPPGPPGSNGVPVVGWTFTDGQGDTQDCERAANFDPSAPRYTCTITSTPSPPASPPPAPTPVPSQSATTPKQASPHRASAPVSTGPGRP